MEKLYIPLNKDRVKTSKDFIKCDNLDTFVACYSDIYYDINKGKAAEKYFDGLLYKKASYSREEIYYILAWKIGGINMKETNYNKEEITDPKTDFRYYTKKGWDGRKSGKSYGRPIEIEKILDLTPELSEGKLEWLDDNKQFASDPGCASELLRKLADSGAAGMGAVYYLTLLYFLTGSRWPIYDIQAYKAMLAIRQGVMPFVDTVKLDKSIKNLPSKENNYSQRLSTILDEGASNRYRQYVDFLKENEQKLSKVYRYTASRDFDRALWVYGHYFKIEK